MSAEWGVLHQVFTRAFQQALHVAFSGALLQTENVHLRGFLFCLFFFFFSIGTWRVPVENEIVIYNKSQ